MALACRPDLVILDEPTTGLDVTTQKRILELLAGLKRETGVSMLYVSHDLAALAQICERVAVMQKGRLVESGTIGSLFEKPRQDYTRRDRGHSADRRSAGRPGGTCRAGASRDLIDVRDLASPMQGAAYWRIGADGRIRQGRELRGARDDSR